MTRPKSLIAYAVHVVGTVSRMPCPKCKWRGTKIIHASSGTFTCQNCDGEFPIPHKHSIARTCQCYLLALEPNEQCPVHGHPWPNRCGVCGQFVKAEGTKTGRFDGSKPNRSNVPRPNPFLEHMREAAKTVASWPKEKP